MTKGFRIKPEEIRKRAGYVFLGAFVFYLAEPLKEFLDTLPLSKWIIGIIGIVATLYFFDFE